MQRFACKFYRAVLHFTEHTALVIEYVGSWSFDVVRERSVFDVKIALLTSMVRAV